MTDLNTDIWRARLLKLTLLRLAGIGLAFIGMIWAATDKLGPPQPIGGALLIVVGLVGGLFLARRLRQSWLNDGQ